MNSAVLYLGFNNFNKFKRGVENVVLNQIAANGSRLNYYICFDSFTGAYISNGVICISIKRTFLRFFLLNYIVLKIKFKLTGKLIIHSHNYLMSLFLILKTNIFTVHDGLYYSFNQLKKSSFATLFGYFSEIIVYKRSSFTHFISKFTKQNSLFFKKDGSFSIIYNCFNPNQPYILQGGEKKIRIPEILIIRSIEERANFELIFELVEFLEIKNIPHQFSIVGKGPLLEYYKNQVIIKNLKNINFTGYLSDSGLQSKYKQSDLIIVPAKYGEGFGLPIIEGYYYNKPVIASDICAIPEVIINQDFLFKNNVKSLYKAFMFALNNTENFNYREYYEKRFSFEKISLEYRQLYLKN